MRVRDRLNVSLISNKKITNPTFVVGFQGVGLVGSMASQHLANNLDCELIGHIESEFLPPIAILHNNSLTFPIRIYYSKKKNIVIVSSEVPVNSEFAFEMSHDIIDLMKKFKSKKVFVLEGLISKSETPNHKKINGVSSNLKMKKFLTKNSVEVIENGAILGIAGSVLLSAIANKIDACALMAECHTNIPDAIAAGNVLKKLGEMLSFTIDTKELEKKGDQIEKKIKDIIKTMKSYKTSEDSKILYG